MQVYLALGGRSSRDDLTGRAVHDGKPTPDFCLAVARDPQKALGINVVQILGTDDELAKPKPDIAGFVNDAGVLVIGPASIVNARTFLAVYDVRVEDGLVALRPRG